MKLHLLAKMLLFLLLPALIGIAALSFIGESLSAAAARAQVEEDLKLMARLQANELNSIITVLRNVTVNLAAAEDIKDYLANVTDKKATPNPALKTLAMESLSDVAESFERIRDTCVVGPDGVILLHTKADSVGIDVSQRLYFKDAMQDRPSGQTVFSLADKEPTTMLSSPVTVNGKVLGVVFTSVNMDALAKTTSDTVRVAKTGYCYVYDSEGRTIMIPKRSLIGDDNKDHPWTWEIMKQESGLVTYHWAGADKIAAFALMPSLGWRVVVTVDEADILSGIRSAGVNQAYAALVVALLVGGILFFMARNMAGSLRGLANFVRYVAQGNLTITPEQQSRLAKTASRSDEIGSLAHDVDGLVQNLGHMVKEAEDKTREAQSAVAAAEAMRVQAEQASQRADSARREGILAAAEQLENAVEVITSASTELSAQIEESERGSALQARRVTETATAMDEMNSTVLEVAKNAASASGVSASTREKAENGAAIVQQVITRIQQVHTQAQQLKADMTQLDDKAKAINQIMSVISDIADQTNLLALNAAIEAARAGEAGRGFAVVADEVRKLAEKTMASTTDVGSAIRAIQQSATQSMGQVDASVTAIDEATALAGQSGVALKEIVTLVDSTADQVRAIATASEQQSASSEEINESISQVNAIAGETARAMQEAAQAVNDLARQSQVLNNLIEDMKRS